VDDTDDEFVIKKPDSTDPAYNAFLNELYKHDVNKPKSKREAIDSEQIPEKLTVEVPQQFDIPVKPSVNGNDDTGYGQFLNHLYRHDELKRDSDENHSRSRRMIIFR
jgi:hypothetical protein